MKTPSANPGSENVVTPEASDHEPIVTQIPECQGDLADRAENEIESDLQWRIDMIRRASREDYSKRMHSRH